MSIGIQFTEVSTDPASTVSAPSAVIALTGCAPIGPVNEVTRCLSATDDAQFGLQVPGFSIPQALWAIRQNDPSAIVLVTNVAPTDRGVAVDRVTITNETKTLVSGATQLAFAPEGAIVVKDSTGATTYTLTTDYTISATGAFARNPSGAITVSQVIKVTYSHLPSHQLVANKVQLPDAPYQSAPLLVYNVTKATTYTEGTDYTVNAYGLLTRLNSGSMTAGQTLIFDYDVFDGITAADIIGTAVPREGLYQFEEALTAYGYMPTIWIAPNYMQEVGVLAAMQTFADTYGGVIFVDCPEGDDIAALTSARSAGSGDVIDISDERVALLYPFVSVYSPAINDTELRPMSPFAAGYQSKIDRLEGPQIPLGNWHNNGVQQPLKGIVGIERTITFNPNRDITSDANTLASMQVFTIRSGNVLWGDRSTAKRDSTAVTTFLSVRRVMDLIKNSIIAGALQFIGRPINKLLIDSILQNGNAYLASLVQDGWIVKGTMVFNLADNPDTEIALGNLTFALTVIPSVPAEQVNYNMNVTVTGLGAILTA